MLSPSLKKKKNEAEKQASHTIDKREGATLPHLLVLDLDEGVEHHGAAVVHVNRVGLHVRLLVLQIRDTTKQKHTKKNTKKNGCGVGEV